MFSENELRNIANGMSQLKNQIVLKVFTDYKTQKDGEKTRQCMLCDGTLNILEILVNNSDGKLTIEEFSTEENPGIIEKYKIEKVPTILFLDEKDKEMIRYMANPTGPELVPFIESLMYFSGTSSYYKDAIQASMDKIDKSYIKLFITLSCPYCPTSVVILNLLAILSKGKIKVEIIDTNINPDIAKKYNVQGVPHTIINEKDHLTGMFNLQDLLEKLTKGKRDLDGMYA